MPTTTFCDIKLTEDVENYNYEDKEYSFSEGDVVSLPYHSANRFVNKYGTAEYDSQPYEVRDHEYEEIVCRVRGSGVETCEEVKSDGEVCGREKPCPYHDE